MLLKKKPMYACCPNVPKFDMEQEMTVPNHCTKMCVHLTPGFYVRNFCLDCHPFKNFHLIEEHGSFKRHQYRDWVAVQSCFPSLLGCLLFLACFALGTPNSVALSALSDELWSESSHSVQELYQSFLKFALLFLGRSCTRIALFCVGTVVILCSLIEDYSTSEKSLIISH